LELRRRNGLTQFGDCKERRVCPECGREFRVSPSSRRVTCCRRECISAHISHTAAGYDLSPMSTGRATSPICQPDEKNASAKKWSVRAPNGEVFQFRNLAHFVRTHRGLFADDELRPLANGTPYAAFGIGLLRPSRARRAESWHGWTWAE